MLHFILPELWPPKSLDLDPINYLLLHNLCMHSSDFHNLYLKTHMCNKTSGNIDCYESPNSSTVEHILRHVH